MFRVCFLIGGIYSEATKTDRVWILLSVRFVAERCCNFNLPFSPGLSLFKRTGPILEFWPYHTLDGVKVMLYNFATHTTQHNS